MGSDPISGKSLGFDVAARKAGCRRGAHAPTLGALIKNKRPETLARSAGPQATGDSSLTSISYLPATLTTLFFLAASLLLGYLQ
jgi:hypothetical protein